MSALSGPNERPHRIGMRAFILLDVYFEMDGGKCWTGGVSYLSWQMWSGGTIKVGGVNMT